MATITTDGLDELMDELDSLSREIPGCECPECGGEFDLPLYAETVTCPHCGVVIQIDHVG